MISPGGSLEVGAQNLVKTFSVGAVMGLVLGLVWLPIMDKVRKEEFSYVLTLAFIFLVYSLVEILVQGSGGGAGAIACLVFGLVLGNGKKVLKMLEYNGKGFEIDQRTKQFHSLTSFIIRTFFFVVLGMLVSFQDVKYILFGVLILAILLIVRYFAVYFSTYKGNFERDDKQTMAVMMPRGLAAAILAINFGPGIIESLKLDLDGFFKDTVFVIILGTAIICTVGVSLICNYENKKIKDPINKNQIDDKQDNP
jgi:NhaP-type Na+/H+ or K+/H+ antiporter